MLWGRPVIYCMEGVYGHHPSRSIDQLGHWDLVGVWENRALLLKEIPHGIDG